MFKNKEKRETEADWSCLPWRHLLKMSLKTTCSQTKAIYFLSITSVIIETSDLDHLPNFLKYILSNKILLAYLKSDFVSPSLRSDFLRVRIFQDFLLLIIYIF